ncbi:MAG: hypothetical protein AAGA69_12070, partial [Pseudomonadota bacterium]
MARTIVIDCGWCASRDQTANIVYLTTDDNSPHSGISKEGYYLAATCRRCGGINTLLTDDGRGRHLPENGDITDAVGFLLNHWPNSQPNISAEI